MLPVPQNLSSTASQPSATSARSCGACVQCSQFLVRSQKHMQNCMSNSVSPQNASIINHIQNLQHRASANAKQDRHRSDRVVVELCGIYAHSECRAARRKGRANATPRRPRVSNRRNQYHAARWRCCYNTRYNLPGLRGRSHYAVRALRW